ncbi:hypothetical protein [Phenylobacterium sp.]|uniref:hypothetical protein n=1 Tax=Phenylobacterium sp. TaxID=1871053 RepID=UPI0035ADDF6E
MAKPSAFPPEPWRLTAEAWASFWLVPATYAPFAPPPGWRPVRLWGRLCVGAAFATYRSPGDLAYRELVAAVLVRRGLRVAVTIPWIWVDSAASRDGARRLWAIPKEMAAFEGWPAHAAPGLAAVDAVAGAALPGRWPAPIRVAQGRGAEPVETPVRLVARLRLARACWRAAGPLAFLDRRRPLLSLRLDDARLLFGREPATLR